MSNITIAFDEKSSAAWGTLVPIEIYDESLARVAEEVVSLSDWRTVPVPGAGLYHVRAELPTGESATATVRVPEQGSAVNVTLAVAEGSPRETLAWAYSRQSVSQVSVPLDDAQSGDVLRSFLPGAPMPGSQVDVVGLYRIETEKAQWRLQRVDHQMDMDEDTSVAAQDPRLIKLMDIRPSGSTDRWFPLYVGWSVKPTPDAAEEVTRFVATPMGESVTLLFVMADEATGTGDPVHIMVSGVRPEAETLLAFMSQGAYGPARRISEDITRQAVELLQAKGADPFAACIAGYFLLRTSRLERQQWMRNLADWFPTVPDGAVIYGTSLLLGERDPAARREARRYLLEAVRRGIPIYTVGLRFLFDSLRTLAEPESRDNQLLSALARIRHVAAYTNWDAQTTTFSLPTEAAARLFRPAE